jgi:hypothetical protein
VSASLTVQFGGNAVSFRTDHPDLFKTLQAHFKSCLAQSGHLVAEYHLTALTGTEFCVAVDGGVLIPRLEFGQVLQFLIQDALTRLNGACLSGPVFHAAALADARGGVILCGQSGSGKSSLAAWLLAKGYRYLSDEVITCAEDGGQISGFARSLVLKKGSAFIWQHFLGVNAREGLLHFPDGSAWIDPLLLNRDGFYPQAAPRLLLFPRYAPEAGFRVTKLTPAEALFRLLQTLVNARNLPDSGLGSAARLARQVSAYSLEYSNLETATAWIQQA